MLVLRSLPWLLALVACSSPTSPLAPGKPVGGEPAAVVAPANPPAVVRAPVASVAERPTLAVAALVRHPEARARCGKLAAKLGPATPVLAGRLLLTPPVGASESPRPWDVMGAPEPTVAESRLMIGGGRSGGRGNDEAMVVLARELWQLDPDLARPSPDDVAQPTTFAAEAPKFLEAVFGPSEISAVALADPAIRAFAAWPKQVELGDRDAAIVLGMLLSMPDGTLLELSFHISPVLVPRAAGCTDLAERIAASLRVGPRQLERRGGVKTLQHVAGRALTIELPADYVTVHQLAEDYDRHEIYKLRPLSLYPGRLSLLVDQYPSTSPTEGPADEVAGVLLGRAVTWRGQRRPNGGSLAVSEPIPGGARWYVHATVHATRQAKYLDEFRQVAETLKLNEP